MASNGGRTGPLWDALCRNVYNTARRTGNTNCGLCHQPVDLDLPYRHPRTRRVNRRSKSVDHITPITNGGKLYNRANLQLAHLECQWNQGGQLNGQQSRNKRRRHNRTRRRQRITSRDW